MRHWFTFIAYEIYSCFDFHQQISNICCDVEIMVEFPKFVMKV